MTQGRTFFTAALIAAGAFAAAAPADARVRSAAATVQTQHGTYQGQSTVQRTRGQRTRQVSVIGPNGGQTSITDQRQWNAQAGTYSHDRTRAFANGDTRVVVADAARTAPGAWSAQRTVTGRNGQTRTQTGTIVRGRTP